MREKKSHNKNTMTFQVQTTVYNFLYMKIPIKARLQQAWELP